jgi:hypothetical protein
MKPITKKILFVLSLVILSVITNAAPAFSQVNNRIDISITDAGNSACYGNTGLMTQEVIKAEVLCQNVF